MSTATTHTPITTHDAGRSSPHPSEAHQRAVGVGQNSDDAIIARAIEILEDRARYAEEVSVSSPSAARELCRLRLGNLGHEVFAVLWLDAQNRLIAFEELFRGTLTQTSVFPREVVKQALAHNAAAAIVAHNHPSGVPEPSMADQMLTRTLKEALALIDCRLLDHLVVGAEASTSFAERGLL
jgi:DNA repair protein RadC